MTNPDNQIDEKGKRRRQRKRTTRRRYRAGERGIMGIDTLPGGGLVSAPISVKEKARKARADRLAATPAPKKERIFGSSQNVSGSARSTRSARNIEMDDATVEALKIKLRQHNVDAPEGRKVTLATLKAVYRRGAGAYSGSHRPGMTRGQWSMGRVNAFLKMLRSGAPKNSRYVNDNDLLPQDHPWRKKAKELREQQFVEVKRLGSSARATRRFVNRAIGGGKWRGRQATYNNNAYDGNSNGTVQDGTIWERPARAIRKVREGLRRRVLNRRGEAPTDFTTMIEKLQDPDGGFSVRVSRMTDIKTGWAVARKGSALQLPVSAFLDKDGKATEIGKRRLLAYVLMLKEQFFDRDLPDGQKVVLGAWHEPFDEKTGEGGVIHLDVTDVYSKKKMDREGAMALGVKQDQKSVADIDAIVRNDWDSAIADTGGTGAPGFDESALTPYLEKLEEEFGPA
jgi:hypothetical protein